MESHLALVPPIATRVHQNVPASVDLDDLLATGYLALVTVANRYRPEDHGGTPFPVFARQRIRGAMLDSIRRRHWRENTMLRIGPQTETGRVSAVATIEIPIDEERLRRRIVGAIASLPENQQAVLAQYYAEKAPSLATVGSVLGLSEWRVVREHAGAIAELRRRLRRTA